MNHEPRASILIVDDQPDNLRTLAAILSTEGYKVRKAISGEIALETVRSQPPDLILLDIRMPQMDGYELCLTFKTDSAICEIPIIFLSALDDTADKVNAFAVGGADYITKPFQSEEVLVRIGHQLTIRRQQQQLKAQNTQLQLLLTTTKAISETDDFHSALKVTLTQVCETIGWDFGEAWIPNSDATVLECSRGWYARDATLESFRQQRKSLIFTPNNGLPGRVLVSKQPEWIVDVSVAPSCLFFGSQIALDAELKTSLGIPIIFRDQVLAILVFFKKAKSEPEPQLIELVSAVAAQLGSLMQRIKVEAALVEANHKLKYLATVDGLTGVANRRAFDEYLSREWLRLFREQLPLSLILGDVDFFKGYNDTYGHQAGDECLRKIANTIRILVKRPADLVARYGGEEFAVILPNTDIQGAIYLAETIRKGVEQLQIEHEESEVKEYVTLSLGVASVIPNPLVDLEALIAQADLALYCAKEQGRNRTVAENFMATYPGGQ